ncbi:MAG: hypothetical protein FWG53_06225 [Clostridiales bacterium]|nr:hypothetical protein [Clostridiales bacterium]
MKLIEISVIALLCFYLPACNMQESLDQKLEPEKNYQCDSNTEDSINAPEIAEILGNTPIYFTPWVVANLRRAC